MYLNAKNIFPVIAHTTVYVAFFAVQLFFNFDTLDNSKTASSNEWISVYSVKNQKRVVEKNTAQPSQKINFRLNKRFQPENIPNGNVIVTDVPVKYVTVTRIVSNTNEFLPAPVTVNHSLRGPPPVVLS